MENVPSSFLLALSPALKLSYYAGASVDWAQSGDDSSGAPHAMGLSTADPYDTVVGYYLGQSEPGDRYTDDRSSPFPEFELFGRNRYVHVQGGPRTRVTVCLHSGTFVPPSRPHRPPQPGEHVPEASVRVAQTNGNLRDSHRTTNPLDQ